jgi:hypothetical protein
MKGIRVLSLSVFLCLFLTLIYAPHSACLNDQFTEKSQTAATSGQAESKIAGEFFGMPVSRENYNFAKRCVLLFKKRWKKKPQTPGEIEKDTWDDLLMSYEAFLRGIEVTDEEVGEEIDNILYNSRVEFDREEDRKEYEEWVRENLKGPEELFKNQVWYLLQISKLRENIIKEYEPEVTEDDIYERFYDEYSSLELDLKEFEGLEEAKELARSITVEEWKRRKEEDPEFSKRLGFVTVIFLNDMWKIPREDLHAMLKLDPEVIYGPTPIYKGYSVFRVMKNSIADDSKLEKARKRLRKNIEIKKKRERFEDWLEDLRKRADLKIYVTNEDEDDIE